jgi:hypothetical protein
MRRRWLLLVLAAMLMVSAVCGGMFYSVFHWRSVEVPDVTQEADLPISARPFDGLGFISILSIRVTGEIDGEAEVWTDYAPHQQIRGQVDWQVGHDWFDPTSHIHYRPRGVTSGKLRVYYLFN